MPRMRTLVVDSDEDIISYEHHIKDKFIRILIGFGVSDASGKFTPTENQNYEQVIIAGLEYEQFMAGDKTRPANQFRKDDLWAQVDFMRNKVLADRKK